MAVIHSSVTLPLTKEFILFISIQQRYKNNPTLQHLFLLLIKYGFKGQ